MWPVCAESAAKSQLTPGHPCWWAIKRVLYCSWSACPAAVTIEGSRDRSQASMVPLCAPASTSGLTTIKVQLLRHEIVSVVTIRLHKPRDSQTIGLSQIMLMGYMAFGDLTGAAASRIANIFTPMEDYVSRTGYTLLFCIDTFLGQIIGALVVTLTMLLCHINCRFIIIIIFSCTQDFRTEGLNWGSRSWSLESEECLQLHT